MTVHRFDGFRIGNTEGMLVEIYDAPWWHVRRWFHYFFRVPRKDRIKVPVGPIGFDPIRTCRCRILDRRNYTVISE